MTCGHKRGDEATVGRPAGGGKLRADPGRLLDRGADGLRKLAARREKRLCAEGPVEIMLDLVPAQHLRDALLQILGGRRRREAEVEVDAAGPGDHVADAGSGMDVGDLECRRREEFVAVVPAGGREFGERRRQHVHRVAGQVRVGHMPLHALYGQPSREGAAPPVLDRVAEPVDRGRLADDAVVDCLAAGAQGFHHLGRAVGRRAFLVRGQQQRDRPAVVRLRAHELLGGHHESGDRALHVRGAAPDEDAIAERRREGVRTPLVERPGRNDIGVPRKDEYRRGAAAPQPEVRHAVAGDGLSDEAQRRQSRGDQRLAAAVIGRDGLPGDQFAGEFEGRVHACGRTQQRCTCEARGL